MADKYNKLEPKVPKEVIYALIGFVVIVLALILIIRPTDSEKFYNEFSAQTVTDDFTEDHPFYELTYKQLVKKLEDEENMVVLFGSSTSEVTVAYIGSYQKYYESTGMNEYSEYIYYFDVSDNADDFEELLETYEDLTTSTNQLVLFIDNEVSVQFVSNGTADSQLINRASRDFFEDAITAIEDAA
jgi:hypothetical protein